MAKVLVTAGAGLIGRAVTSALVAEGIKTIVLDTRPLNIEGVPQVFGRVRDPEPLGEALEGCTDVFHLEWSGGVRETTQAPLVSHEGTVTESLRLLEIAKQRDLGFFFASTCLYAGDKLEPLAEEDPVSDKSLYAIQKRYVETMLTGYARNFGLRGASLRIFNAYGRGGRPGLILNQIRRVLTEGGEITMNGDGDQVRDFIHVSDVASAFVAALRTPELQGETMNVATGIGTSMLELVHLAAEVAGKEIPVVHVPAKGEESRFLVADISRAKTLLGWSPKVALRDGIALS